MNNDLIIKTDDFQNKISTGVADKISTGIAICNGKIYEYQKLSYEEILVTSNPAKLDGKNFIKFYIPIIDSKDISDIFDIEYFVEYDTGLEDVPTTWKVSYMSKHKDSVLAFLTYEKGYLPGWEIDGLAARRGKTRCSIWIDVSAFSQAKIKTTFEKKDGKILNPPIIEERIVDVEQLVDEYMFYSDEVEYV